MTSFSDVLELTLTHGCVGANYCTQIGDGNIGMLEIIQHGEICVCLVTLLLDELLLYFLKSKHF